MEKILHISKYYYPFFGGIEQVARDCVNSLNENEQKVICFNHEKGSMIDTVDGVEITRVGCECKVSSQSISLGYKKALKKLMKEFRPSIVIFHYPNPFVAHFLLKVLPKNTKFVLYWHCDIVKQKILGKLFNLQNEKLLKRADKVIATSPNYIEGSKWLIKYKDKCKVIPCAVCPNKLILSDEDMNEYKTIIEENKNKKIIFGFGRHVKYKGLIHLIEAASYLSDDYMIYIAGKGDLTEQLNKEAEKHKNVVMLGKVNVSILKAYLYACDVFAFPSITKNEAFGIGLAEAMAYGKPAVTFTIPGSGVNFVNLNNVTGLEVENGNSKAFADAILKICTDEALKEKFGTNAKDRIIELCSFVKFKENINTLIKEAR